MIDAWDTVLDSNIERLYDSMEGAIPGGYLMQVVILLDARPVLKNITEFRRR